MAELVTAVQDKFSTVKNTPTGGDFVLAFNTAASGDPVKLALSTLPAPSITSGNISDFSEAVDDRVGALLQAGTNVTLTYNDVANTLTIAAAGGGTVTLTGDVTGSGTGSFATTIAGGAVTLAKMANLAANSILGNNTGSPATPIALTAAQVASMLPLSSSLAVTSNQLRVTGTETNSAASISSGTATFNLSSVNSFTLALTENITTWTITNVPATANTTTYFTVYCSYSGAQRTLPAASSSIKYAGGTTPPVCPSAAGNVLVLLFSSVDQGTTWLISSSTYQY